MNPEQPQEFPPHHPDTAPDLAQDKALDRLLRDLIAIEPAADLEARILQTLANRQPETVRRTWPQLAMPLRFATLAVAVALGLALVRHHHLPKHTAGVTPVLAPTPDVVVVGSVATTSPVLRWPGEPRLVFRQVPHAGTTFSARVGTRHPGTVTLASVSPPPEPASRPAPPMPLTEQERLLLEYIHRRDRKELAALDPAAASLHEVADRAAFEQFFAQPPLPPQPVLPSPQPEPPTGDPE